MPDRIQIVLDADVIIHFSLGGYLHLLPKVIPDCSFVVLSVVRNELRQETRKVLDNHIYYAFKRGLMTKEEIDTFVQKVRSAGSILPDMDIDSYYCSVF